MIFFSIEDHLYNAYTNLKIEERRSQITQIQIQISELTGPDRPRVDIEVNNFNCCLKIKNVQLLFHFVYFESKINC